MIEIKIFRDTQGAAAGLCSIGHAEYGESGEDIVCAAVSALELNLANSVAEFTDARFSCQINENTGGFEFRLIDTGNKDAALLLSSCLLGLEAVHREYGSNYLIITDQEV